MASGKKHFATGFLIGAAYSGVKNYFQQQKLQNEILNYKFNWVELALKMLFGGTVGGVAGVLPDVIEPAINPGHRKSFHSIAAAVIATIAANKANKSKAISSEAKEIINISAIAYGSHLFLDSQTPSGIPII